MISEHIDCINAFNFESSTRGHCVGEFSWPPVAALALIWVYGESSLFMGRNIIDSVDPSRYLEKLVLPLRQLVLNTKDKQWHHVNAKMSMLGI